MIRRDPPVDPRSLHDPPFDPRSLHIMRDCWLEPYTLRPSFTDLVLLLENIMENDAVRTNWLLWFRCKILLQINC